ncbi:MAG: Bro-N domain-containing protein [Candidatus Nomurabacteria bacterium]|jgi:prophage antirepressor-like protein|nr:Bro-N domain-containing protein [Candidatus Nomurabacteria bacterium]
MSEELKKIAIFRNKRIRRVVYGGEWWFVINDVIEALTDSVNPADYLKKMRKRDPEFDKIFRGDPSYAGRDKLSPPAQLEVDTPIGKRKAYCWYTEGIFRLVQSIPSPKAEPFKRWLAQAKQDTYFIYEETFAITEEKYPVLASASAGLFNKEEK